MMNKKLMYLLSLAMLSIGILACDDDDMAPAGPTESYEGCCATAPIEGQMPGGDYYIPNLFTPNGDGINDVFYIFASGGITEVVSMVITNQDGQQLFSQSNVQPSNLQFGWDGSFSVDSVYQGLFNYTLIIADSSGAVDTLMAQACSFDCDSDQFPASNIANCFFGTQHNGDGRLDINTPTNEGACF